MHRNLVYTDAGKAQLEAFVRRFRDRLETYLAESNWVPGDDYIEVTASDIERAKAAVTIRFGNRGTPWLLTADSLPLLLLTLAIFPAILTVAYLGGAAIKGETILWAAAGVLPVLVGYLLPLLIARGGGPRPRFDATLAVPVEQQELLTELRRIRTKAEKLTADVRGVRRQMAAIRSQLPSEPGREAVTSAASRE